MGKEHFTTLDAYLAAFLAIRGHRPNLVAEGAKIVFVFEPTPLLYENIYDYNAGAVVPASQLAAATKMLRGQMRAMKMENGINVRSHTHR